VPSNAVAGPAGGSRHARIQQVASTGHSIFDVQTRRDLEAMQFVILDAQGLSVKAMQSINIFTVGGKRSE